MSFDFNRTWGPKPKYPTVCSIDKRDYSTAPIKIAGPCSIENKEQVEKIVSELKRHDITFMRGGVYRAGTYPPENYGLQPDMLYLFSEIAHDAGLKIIVEVIDYTQFEQLDYVVDAFQVGTRHMQDYKLLTILADQPKPVTLKRSIGSTLDEFLGAAEYLVRRGKRNVILIERGGATFHNHVRWDLSISIIPAVKRITGLPILVDASHGTGRRDLVLPMTLAGIAAGADGFLVEVHPEPDQSISDAEQAIDMDTFDRLNAAVNSIYQPTRGTCG